MPINTNLNRAPYFNDYDETQDYYGVLFVPGVSVQTRELNYLQSMLQKQIERFGDAIFKRGTIVDGCNFQFYNKYPYVKLVDAETDGTNVIPALYIGYFAKNSANLRAYIINAEDGFEASDPDLKTIFVNYINSGQDGNTNAFTPGDTLTIYDSNNSIHSVVVENGGISFSNSDTVIFTPALVVNVATGSFSNGDYLIQPSTGANVIIVDIDETTLADQGQVILHVKPRAADLANSQSNSTFWTFDVNEEVYDSSNNVAGVVEKVYGQSAAARVITTGSGRITNVVMIERGNGYEIAPQVTVKSANNSTGINALQLTAKNYRAQVKVFSDNDAVGHGYAFGVTEGVIYQKGYFLRVAPQTVIVDKYSRSPNNISVGFETEEEIVDSDIDTSLLDNATGEPNENAPGAHRLKLTPVLKIVDTDSARANDEFFSLVEWNNGNPYKQNQVSQYSRLGDEMAQRTFDQSGNFVVDNFQVATSSTSNNENEGKFYQVVVDPGQAYIGGRKVQTLRNFHIDVTKGLDTRISNNIISLNYGNYIRIKEIGGLFQFSTGDVIKFYNAPKGFLSNTGLIEDGDVNPEGTQIGTARIRSLIHENGTPGDPNHTMRLFLFDIKMNPGQNFRDVRSVYYDGTNKGIADVVLEVDVSTGQNIAVVKGSNNNKLLFSAGVESLKNSNNTNYIYRTIDQNASVGNNGILTKSIASSPNEFFPYTGTLSDAQMKELYVVPIGNNLIQYVDMNGNVSVNSTSNVVVGDGTNFFSDFKPGDYVRVWSNTLNWDIKKVVSIVNATYLTTDSNWSFANTQAKIKRVFPKHVPIPFGDREGLTANVNANGNVLTLRFGHSNGDIITFEGTGGVNTAIAVNIERRGVTSTSKTAQRSKFVKICLANNSGGVDGPWCLGVPDIFRLRSVYIGNSSVNTSSTDAFLDFYIDHNQTANYLDLGWLYKKPRTSLQLTANDWLLVEFDYFTRSGAGYFDTVSYLNTSNAEQIAVLDATPLANLTTSAASLEVPEVYTYKGEYFDLLNQLDFRPAVEATATPGDNPGAAPVNPDSTISFGNTADPTNDKKFPLPDSRCETTIEQYLGRLDSVFIGGDKGNIFVLKGTPEVDPRKRYEANHPKEALKLQTINVPPYPNITDVISGYVQQIIRTGVANEKNTHLRLKSHVISPMMTSYDYHNQQPMVYTMEDIGNLERRIRDLEYYVSLSVLETSITNKVIPSSVDRSLNRFKFGFFADDFQTEHYSDLENPQYAASIEVEGFTEYGAHKNPLETQGDAWATLNKTSPIGTMLSPSKINTKRSYRVVPPKYIWTIPHHVENFGYSDELVIDQQNATDSWPQNNCAPVPIPGNVVSITNAYYYTFEKASSSSATSRKTPKIDTVMMGAIPDQVTLWFYNYSARDKIEVYQGDQLVAGTTESLGMVSPLTQQDKTFLNSSETTKAWRNLISSSSVNLDKQFVRGTGDEKDFVTYAGKITWQHNPSNGLNYTIKTSRGTGSIIWKWIMEYPMAGASYANTIVDPCIPAGDPPLIYVGTITFPSQAKDCWACSKNFRINSVNQTVLDIDVTGLKPKTIHEFWVDNINQSMRCIPKGKKMNDALLTDANGKVSFRYSIPSTGTAKKHPNQTSNESWLKAVYDNWKKGVTYGSAGYNTFTVKAENSSATLLVARRNESKPLPTTPLGNP